MNVAAAQKAVKTAPDDVMFREVMQGLAQEPKRLPCKFFYDELGSRLFERICELDEYYLTRTELGILSENAAEIAALAGAGAVLLEFGSGASVKTRLLLDALERPQAYVPIDISRSALLASVAALRSAYPSLDVRPICGDYLQELELPLRPSAGKMLVFFPGSTIGNFDPPDALAFLRRVRRHCEPDGMLLIGVDLKKDRATLEAAYDDRRGVTAEFNRNILRAINRECSARFSLEHFSHRAIYNERAGRIEMHLVSEIEQSVLIGSERVQFGTGERIVTEHCYKYDLDQFRGLAHKSGFTPRATWTDPNRLFCVQLLRAT